MFQGQHKGIQLQYYIIQPDFTTIQRVLGVFTCSSGQYHLKQARLEVLGVSKSVNRVLDFEYIVYHRFLNK